MEPGRTREKGSLGTSDLTGRRTPPDLSPQRAPATRDGRPRIRRLSESLGIGRGDTPLIAGAGWFLAAVAAACGCAAAVPLASAWLRGGLARAASWGFALGTLACPLLIPSGCVGLRAGLAFLAANFAFKIADFLRQFGPVRGRARVGDYARFLIPFPLLVVVYPDHRRRLARPDGSLANLARIVGGAIGLGAGVVLLVVLRGNATLIASFALDHVVRLLAFVLAIESISRLLFGLERLAGFDTTPIVRNAILSRTVGEFWRRYNGRVHDWFFRNVFLPGGGRHTPARGVWLVFLVSAIFHEIMFDIATSRVTGYQFAFFLVQAPAALASGKIERLARRGGIAGKVVAHGSTILFLATTSVLFFHGVSQVFPAFYAGESPLP